MRQICLPEPRRRGIVSVVVLVVLMLIAGLLAQYARRAVSERRQLRTEFQHQQAVALADAGILRMKQHLAQDPDFEAETWKLPAGTIHQTNSATVQISVVDKQGTVVARYPSNAEQPLQVTRKIILDD